mmetsp:Transcript_15984/g.35786  ORF Transcript_15984/g.35786 Transcript_15984/m.35786 type:complete len:170 (+) Transcript_15984:397-906(+)
MPQLPSSRDNSIAAIAAASSIEPALSRSNKRTTKSYKQISEFLDPRTEKYANRLNKLCNHVAIKTTAKKGEKITEKVMTSDGTVQVMERSTDRAARYSCLCCCEKCDDHVKHPTRDAHYRAGRRTSMYCSVAESAGIRFTMMLFQSSPRVSQEIMQLQCKLVHLRLARL